MTVGEHRLSVDARVIAPLAAPTPTRGQLSDLSGGWPTRRPSLAYQWALDVATLELRRMGGSPLILSTHPLLGQEAARRLDVDWPNAADQPAATHSASHLASSALWIEPVRADWYSTLARIGESVDRNGLLLVMTGVPWLSRGLPERTAPGVPPAAQLLGSRAIVQRLRLAGWHVDRVLGLRGPRALGFGILERLALRVKRPALADRLGVSMRASFMERGPLTYVSTIALVSARPPGWQEDAEEASR
ncbi:MAG: hypothetical protein AB7K36_23585 [Chloroflexota bacterium]